MVSLNMHAIVNPIPSVSTTGKPLVVASTSSLSFDSVQLTEATRPMRRLYVENVPASASEKAMMESFNNFLLSSGISHIHRTKPCISCIIHKGKGQALVEFLTPEDASAAHSVDGSIFSGSVLKIKRPKDFIELVFRQLLFSCRLVNWRNQEQQRSQSVMLWRIHITRYSSVEFQRFFHLKCSGRLLIPLVL
ncbi:splicing factor U2af large subunit B-like [Hibiscus syriacus]|uniref:splicing factor U2af large subunit B-like n=1 Tax=Hibiscus syriacus TaxID=106335 RepID=UPI0019237CAA|nr:splicing factor U2af large subunit B-like [Hibiscus syriacus]XP_039048804.1 splicing factor U2af large subunit B-like [Hibiscus syriacus]